MRKCIAIIFAIELIVCTLAASFMLMGYSTERKDAQDRMAAQIELDRLMAQVETGALDLDAVSDAEYMTIAHTVCELVDRSGMITEAAHYFRNCFARAPNTLDEMMAIIRYEEGGRFGWKLVSRKGTWLHMFGRNGEYNMKFISADGHFEAIYNIDGVKLTGENDSMNMGTFNYADSVNEKLRHAVYDVLPFFVWGNSRESVKQANGLSDDLRPIKKRDGAMKRFEKYRELLYGRKTEETSNPLIGYFKYERLNRGIYTSPFRLCSSMITFVSTEPP